jgi:TonB-dependent receptor
MKWKVFAIVLVLIAMSTHGAEAQRVAGSAASQNGSIRGTIVDGATGKKLPGVNILLMGTSLGGITDLDGRFEIVNIPPGTYDIRVMYEGYVVKMVTGAKVEPGQTFEVSVRMVRDTKADAASAGTYRIDDVVVTAEKVLSTDASVLVERMKASTIGDAISAEQIARSPDATSGDALKRVTGLSVMDDKYVYIRGVTDRYNSTELNGVPVTSTSTDADKKSFAFDLIPAALMSNSVVIKTATPDLPGDFSGGLVQVNTTEFPERRVITLAYGSAYNTNATGKELLISSGGGKDWTGKDDGSRALPQGLEGVALAQALPNNWGTQSKEARPNGRYGISIGDRLRLGEQELGFVGSLTYKTDDDISDFRQEPKRNGDIPYFEYEGTRYTWDVLWGGLLNLTYKPWQRHKLGIKNSYNRNAREYVSQSEGVNENNVPVRRQTTEWEQRDIYVGQVSGNDTFGLLDGLELNWEYHGSRSEAKEPDRKHIEYGESTTQPGSWVMKENYRTWSALDENSRGGGADAKLDIGPLDFKTGFLLDRRERSYNVESFFSELPQYRPGQIPDWDLLLLDVSDIFAPENYGKGVDTTQWGPVDGFNFFSQTAFTGEYTGTADLDAYYGMIDAPFYLFGEYFRFAGGARVEDSKQTVNTIVADQEEPIPSEIDKKDVLPSANLTYHFNEATNVRLGYYKSVNRPEFREMSAVLYYDFNTSELVRGNPNLERALIQNYDIRIEWFPGMGEVLAASYFYKDLTDPIEEKLIPSPERFLRTWFNSPEGRNYGYELELRKSLGFIADPLKYVTVMGNYTKVTSEIKISEQKNVVEDSTISIVTIDSTRPLQGQAPWMINAGLQFYYPRVGTSLSLLYNRIGRRLNAVGETREDDVYEEPRDQLDFALTQEFGLGFKAKFTIKNILGEDTVFTSGSQELLHSRHTNATKYTLSLSFNM